MNAIRALLSSGPCPARFAQSAHFLVSYMPLAHYILGNGTTGAAMLLRVRQCVAAVAPSRHASKLRPSIAAARAVATGHAPVAVSEHRLHPPFARYAHGTVVEPHSQLVFTSGTLGIHKDGSIPASAEDQARLALGNVLEILRAAGANEKNVVRINAFVSHRDHLPAYMKARDETMGGVPPTASTLMVVSGFARPEFLVEVQSE